MPFSKWFFFKCSSNQPNFLISRLPIKRNSLYQVMIKAVLLLHYTQSTKYKITSFLHKRLVTKPCQVALQLDSGTCTSTLYWTIAPSLLLYWHNEREVEFLLPSPPLYSPSIKQHKTAPGGKGRKREHKKEESRKASQTTTCKHTVKNTGGHLKNLNLELLNLTNKIM